MALYKVFARMKVLVCLRSDTRRSIFLLKREDLPTTTVSVINTTLTRVAQYEIDQETLMR